MLEDKTHFKMSQTTANVAWAFAIDKCAACGCDVKVPGSGITMRSTKGEDLEDALLGAGLSCYYENAVPNDSVKLHATEIYVCGSCNERLGSAPVMMAAGKVLTPGVCVDADAFRETLLDRFPTTEPDHPESAFPIRYEPVTRVNLENLYALLRQALRLVEEEIDNA